MNSIDVLEEVIRLGTVYPNARYNNSPCLYTRGEVENGPPDKYGCIIGQALINCGVEKEKLEFFDENNWPKASAALRVLGIDSEHDEELDYIQCKQDRHSRWGYAVAQFRKIFTDARGNSDSV